MKQKRKKSRTTSATFHLLHLLSYPSFPLNPFEFSYPKLDNKPLKRIQGLKVCWPKLFLPPPQKKKKNWTDYS